MGCEEERKEDVRDLELELVPQKEKFALIIFKKDSLEQISRSNRRWPSW